MNKYIKASQAAEVISDKLNTPLSDLVDVFAEIPAKFDQNKPRLDLVPPAIIEVIGHVRTYGALKYKDPENWRKVEPERYQAALMRHLCEYMRNPKSIDVESGLPHLWHMACNIAFLCEMDKEATDDK